MMYVWALCRDQEELNPYAAWRLLDISASSTEQILWDWICTKHSQPGRERTVRKQGPAAWEQNTGDKGTIKWDGVSLNSKNTVK